MPGTNARVQVKVREDEAKYFSPGLQGITHTTPFASSLYGVPCCQWSSVVVRGNDAERYGDGVIACRSSRDRIWSGDARADFVPAARRARRDTHESRRRLPTAVERSIEFLRSFQKSTISLPRNQPYQVL